MKIPAGLAILSLALLAACSARERTTQLQAIDPNAGYRYGTLERIGDRPPADTFVVVTFSGGGTRAAALASGALQGLAAASISADGGTANFADRIDLISSVSGGSVIAAYYGLHGRRGLPDFTANFLKRNVQGRLVGEALLPWTWVRLATPSYARIDALRDYFDEQVFDHATYQSLLDAAADPKERHPYIVLNAADMSNGSVFSFTQSQFDLICADLSKLSLADAVSASAAFPVALTALTLKNRAPCPAQKTAAADPLSGWRIFDGRPRPIAVQNAIQEQVDNPGRYRRGLQELGYLNEEGTSPYIQLLDGGTADNLGLTEPLDLMTSPDYTPSILNRINTGKIKRVVVVVVNARAEPDNTYGATAGPPGTISTLLTTIGTPIDGTSYAMLERLQAILQDPDAENLVETTVVPVDFDFIKDPTCRRDFKNIGTSWALPAAQVDALLAVGGAMVRESPKFRELVTTLNGTIAPGPGVADACKTLTAVSN